MQNQFRPRFFVKIFILPLYLFFLFLSAPLRSQFEIYDISGKPSIIDANTLRFRSGVVRFLCLKAPELVQPYGREALKTLKKIINGQLVHCQGRWYDNYNSILALCKMGEIDLNESILKHGLAVANGGYKCGLYKKVAELAKKNRVGMWSNPNFKNFPARRD